MTSYTAVRKQPAFDWRGYLHQPRLTEAEAEAACRLSCSWVTCACGHQCAALPRHPGGIPLDLRLAELGEIFTRRVDRIRESVSCGGPWYHAQQRALETLQEIEDRSAELLRQLPTQAKV